MRKSLSRVLLSFVAGCALLTLPPSRAVAMGAETTAAGAPALLPNVRESQPAGILPLDKGISVSAPGKDAEDRFAARDLIEALTRRGIRAEESNRSKAKILLLRVDTKRARQVLARASLRFEPAMQEEGYILVSQGETTYDIAATAAGLFYGAQTLKQLVAPGAPAMMKQVRICDWPAMRYRGLSDDISRGPVPTLAFQKHVVRLLSEYKMNIYSPYLENTLRYSVDPLAAPPGGAMTRADVAELVRYARQYHVTIVPEQESFAHLHHTLEFESYAKLAETPHGDVLAPGQPGSIALIAEWFTEIASIFPSPFLHVGADETFDLGRGQTRARVEQTGLGAVYIDFLARIHAALAPLDRRLLFWGDIALHDPTLIATLPKDMVAVAWEYDPHPSYDRWLAPYVQAGMETWVAPAVSNWGRVYPDDETALKNIQQFVADGQRLGSTGELNTEWCDDGEALFNQTWQGVVFGAAAAWQPGKSSIAEFERHYSQIFYGDRSDKIRRAQQELMVAESLSQRIGFGVAGDDIFWVDPWSPRGQKISAALLPVAPALRLHAEQAIVLIEQARDAGTLRHADALDAMELGARRLDFIGYKFQAAQEIADEYSAAYRDRNDPVRSRQIRRTLETISGLNGRCQDLRDGYGLIRDLYRQAWLKEDRPYWLDNILARYQLNMQLWIGRGDRFGDVTDQWSQTHTLPSPEEAGIPSRKSDLESK